jgi:hypothetical protein
MSQKRQSFPASFQVLVMEMSHYADDDGESTVSGFPNREEAIEYARRRLRDSLEELRKANQSVAELKRLWLLFGEDALVPSDPAYSASSELDFFLRHPATQEERDWAGIEKRLGTLIITSSRQ